MLKLLRTVAIVALCQSWLAVANAAENGGQASEGRVTVYTQTPGAMAQTLILHALQQRQIRVIVGLRMQMQPAHALSEAQADQQVQQLRGMQGDVAMRVLGRKSGSDIVNFDFIPYMSIFVKASQVRGLLADPQVVSITEDIPSRPSDTQSIPLIHADLIWSEGFQGSGHTVAILDSGVAKTYPALAGRVRVGSLLLDEQGTIRYFCLPRQGNEQYSGGLRDQLQLEHKPLRSWNDCGIRRSGYKEQ